MQTASFESAADVWGLPTRAGHGRFVTVPRTHSRPVPGATARRADLRPDEVDEVDGVLVTSPLRTAVDCARTLPFGWGLAVADAALRTGLVTSGALHRAAREHRGPGTAAVRRVARHADPRAESPLESLARALLIEADLGPVALQVRLDDDGHPFDLGVGSVLVECDGATHRTAERLAHDCQDACEAAAVGRLLLRFTWYDVTHRPRWVVGTVQAALSRADALSARRVSG